MAFSSILSNNADPVPKPTSTPSAKPRKTLRQSIPTAPAAEPMSRDSSRQSSLAPAPTPTISRVPAKRKANGELKKTPPKQKQMTKEQEKEIQSIMANLDAEASDIDIPEFETD